MTADSILECSGLSVGYGLEEVLAAVHLTVERGIILPFVGPNGSGKTTLLRAFLGLIPIRAGSLRRRFGKTPPAYVPQQKQIDPLFPVSVRRIVTMGLYPELGFWRLPTREHNRRINHTLERFGLLAHQSKTFGELSGGMRQKTLVARAFVSDSDVWVLDEPTAGLDAASEGFVLNTLIQLSRDHGKTILLAHHRLEDLSLLAETVCLVDEGTTRYAPAAEIRTSMPGSFREGHP